MSRVFVAVEVALDRTVVIKVLPPELAAGLSADRFRREIQLAARLQHPHIVPLLTAGQAGEFLYYTMPFVEGESLRARLQKQGELPVALAVRLLIEITRALAYAHRRGIVHRDIKPENVLLAGDEVQVADFGIAKAVSAAVEGDTLTSVGLAIGTPTYMAPEQAAADPGVDHRVDLYALGVVAYEMLAGQPPFSGRTAAQLLAAHATQPVRPLASVRPSVPAVLAELVMRLLEKRPADRPQTADEVLSLLEAATPAQLVPTVPVPSPDIERAAAVPPHPGRGRWMVAGGVAALALVASIAWLTNRDKPVHVDRSVIAVAPFRVNASDSALRYLREGMVDLLATKLGGTAALRPADPHAFLSVWRREVREPDVPDARAAAVASAIGAGRLVRGEVIGSRQSLTLAATLLNAPAGTVAARASVEGPADSLPRLVDALAAKLLALGAGEDEQRLASLASTSLPALRAYLDGVALFRRGAFAEARQQFESAMDLDSTFALAGLAHARADEWLGGGRPRGLWLAGRHRDRLGRRERDQLAAYTGPRFPAYSPGIEYLEAAERSVNATPDSPEALYKLGDWLYHFGELHGIADAVPRARAAFSRAAAIDSTFLPALEHMEQVSLAAGDTAAARRALNLYLKTDSASPFAAGKRLYVATHLGDSALKATAWQDDSLPQASGSLLSYALNDGIGFAEVGALLDRRARSAVTSEQRESTAYLRYVHAVALGQPTRAGALLASLPEMQRLSLEVLTGEFADGDSTAAARAASRLEREVGRPLRALDGWAVHARYAVGQYAISRNRPEVVRRVLADLRRARPPADSGWMANDPEPYALVLEAQMAALSRAPGASARLAALDSALAATGGMGGAWLQGALVSARLHEQRGELAAALNALRRRVRDLWNATEWVAYHREEGRLAALMGDKVAAAQSYRRYLAVRSDPEPRLRAQVEQVRGDLRAVQEEPLPAPAE
jgi:eukaryotic-like serine/threonine-protein kinase